jgi:hypothetical protein
MLVFIFFLMKGPQQADCRGPDVPRETMGVGGLEMFHVEHFQTERPVILL